MTPNEARKIIKDTVSLLIAQGLPIYVADLVEAIRVLINDAYFQGAKHEASGLIEAQTILKDCDPGDEDGYGHAV